MLNSKNSGNSNLTSLDLNRMAKFFSQILGDSLMSPVVDKTYEQKARICEKLFLNTLPGYIQKSNISLVPHKIGRNFKIWEKSELQNQKNEKSDNEIIKTRLKSLQKQFKELKAQCSALGLQNQKLLSMMGDDRNTDVKFNKSKIDKLSRKATKNVLKANISNRKFGKENRKAVNQCEMNYLLQKQQKILKQQQKKQEHKREEQILFNHQEEKLSNTQKLEEEKKQQQEGEDPPQEQEKNHKDENSHLIKTLESNISPTSSDSEQTVPKRKKLKSRRKRTKNIGSLINRPGIIDAHSLLAKIVA